MSGANGAAPKVLETGVPCLDRILGGGLLRGAVAMVVGAPGTGKTVLAQQIAFHEAAQGGRALYLTGYSETHDKLLKHVRGFSFFKPDFVGQQIQLASLPDLLGDGAEATEDAIIATARAQRASLVIFDGFRSMRAFLPDDHAAAHFVYSLGAKLALLGATTLLIAEGDADQSSRYPEMTSCDVIVALRRQSLGSRTRRVLDMLKARGLAPLVGSHPFGIDHNGVSLSPRFESVVSLAEPTWNPGRASFGIADLDALIGGGLNVGTTTLVAGSPGVGKTTLGLGFIAEGARAQEPVLYLGFMESVAQLREKARVMGMDLSPAEASGLLRFLVLPAFDLEADTIAALLAEDVERRGVRRLVIDSAAEIERAIGYRERAPGFLAAMVSYLRGREVTTYMSLDVPLIIGPALEISDTPLSVVAENLLLLRHVEYRNRIQQVLSILKMRFSDYDRAIYEFRVTPGRGLQIVGPAPLGEGFLTGVPRVPPEPTSQSESGDDRGAAWPQS